jgi:hypothetical protein
MRKLGIWLALCLITAVGIITGWNWHLIQFRPRAVETSFRQSSTADTVPDGFSDAPIVAPSINADRLMTDVEALAFNRFDAEARERAQRYIVRQLRDAGWQPQLQSFNGGTNIYAERSGTDPQAGAILVGAHYDTVARSPGADDNATAVAAVLEIARVLGDRPTSRPLKLVLFDQEETGLVGSFAFANQKEQTDSLQAAIILEMIGYACQTAGCQKYPPVLPITPPTDVGNFLAVIGDQGHLPLINAFSEAATNDNLPQVLTLPVPLLGPFTPDLLRSDHAPFWQKGIGAVMVTDTANFRNPNYHQVTDTASTIDPQFFSGSTQIVVNAVTNLLSTRRSLATQPSIPQRAESRDVTATPI